MIAPVLLLLLVLVVGFGCARWAWGYQQRVLRVLRARPSHIVAPAAVAASSAAAEAAQIEAQASRAVVSTAARVAVRQLKRPHPTTEAPASVLGWDAFSVVSTLVLDGTVLVACRRQPAEPFPARGCEKPLPAEQATLVFLIGDDERAGQAVDLLEGWRVVRARLRLRPTPVPGAIEVYDGRRSAMRAALLAA